MKTSQFGYLGLSEPYTATWADTREVTVYPTGKVIDESTEESNKIEQKDMEIWLTVAGIALGVGALIYTIIKRK